MRIKKGPSALQNTYKLMIVDDDEGLIDSISSFLTRNGYEIHGFANPLDGLDELGKVKYDLLILDYFMSPIKGDDFVSRLREFDRDLYVILLTGHKDLAPPLTTIKEFDIQAYCEKSHRLDQLLLLIESGVKSISQMREIRKYRDGLDNILAVLPEIYQLKPLEALLDAVLAQTLALTSNADAFILVDGPGGEEHAIFKKSGTFGISADAGAETLSPSLLEAVRQAEASRATISADNMIILPLINADGLVQGVICTAWKAEHDDIHLLEIFAGQAAAAIHNAHLHAVIDMQAEELTHAYTNLKSSYVETIEALRLAVDTKDVYTRGHSDRVSLYAQLIGKKLGISEDDLENLRIGGLFHDIGKIGTSNDILLKTVKLSNEEFTEIKKHPTKGVVILSPISAFEKIIQLVGSHHERIDGKGYPDGLAGNDIPYGARIIGVADAFDAMTSERHYRKKFTPELALEQLKEGRGTQFDSDIADCFISIAEENAEQVSAILNYSVES